jgi:hypothetical protein
MRNIVGVVKHRTGQTITIDEIIPEYRNFRNSWLKGNHE